MYNFLYTKMIFLYLSMKFNMLWIFNLVEKNQQKYQCSAWKMSPLKKLNVLQQETGFYELLWQRWLCVKVITVKMWWPQDYHSKTDMLTLQGLWQGSEI